MTTPDLIEHIAKQWDGCMYDAHAVGEIDIGQAIRQAARASAPAAPPSTRRATNAEVLAWSERHDLGVSSLVDLRAMFEDAQTLCVAHPPTTTQPEPDLRMDAYYYSFKSTGNPAIDLILSAVACAGKAYHHTEMWQELIEEPYPGHTGYSCVEWIQNAANKAAAPPPMAAGLGEPTDVRAIVMDVFENYRCQYQQQGDDNGGLPLFDVLGRGFKTVEQGRDEAGMLADEIVSALSAAPSANQGVTVAAWQDPDCPRHIISAADKRDFTNIDLNSFVTYSFALRCTRPLYAAPVEGVLRMAREAIQAERQRQINAEGYDTAHDDEHNTGDLAAAASAYALQASREWGEWRGYCWKKSSIPIMWPWDDAWWKPKGVRSNLVRAGALILAEIERLDRAAIRSLSPAEGKKP